MGGSALRGMAFGKAVIIVGERGFSSLLTPESAETFYYKGIYGIGDGNPSNTRLITDIRELVEYPDRLATLGELSRQFVVRNFQWRLSVHASLIFVTKLWRRNLHFDSVQSIAWSSGHIPKRAQVLDSLTGSEAER